jgi:hypothetical protein
MNARAMGLVAVVLGNAAIASTPDFVASLPTGWQVALIGAIASVTASLAGSTLWFIKRTIAKADDNQKKAEAHADQQRVLLTNTRDQLADLGHKLERHMAEEGILLGGFVRVSDMRETTSSLHDKMNRAELAAEKRFTILEGKLGMHGPRAELEAAAAEQKSDDEGDAA